jgi:hypothetical protein
MKPVAEMTREETITAGAAALDYFEECLRRMEELERELKEYETGGAL